MYNFGIVLLCVLTLTSCAHAPKVSKKNEVQPVVVGAVLSPEILVQGGDLALVGLKAGPKAEANDELDHVSAIILKGIKESLDGQNSSLNVIAPDQGQPTIVLEGFIEEFSKSSRISRISMRPNRNHISVSGELWLRATGQRLLNFSTSRVFNPKKDKLVDVAYQMGKDIGEFIVSHTK